jgi:hypothetical protein
MQASPLFPAVGQSAGTSRYHPRSESALLLTALLRANDDVF